MTMHCTALTCQNLNQLWGYILSTTLKHLGLKCAVICPGSRSTPLVVALSQQSDIELIPILDERSAGFFALGRAKATGLPTAILCTSGTAGANFYPAVIEARESRVPILVLTCDRPAELRYCHSGQTIDQVKLYGNYVNWQAELALPTPEMTMLAYLRQTVIYAWERCQAPVKGAVHLNIPFRDPLAPIPDDINLTPILAQFNAAQFFQGITNNPPFPHSNHTAPIPPEWLETESGLIIAGVAQPQAPDKYCQAIAQLAQTLKWPVLAEGLSPVRNHAHLNPNLISTYDIILRNQHITPKLSPKIVLQVGEMPTSKELRQWLTTTKPRRWVIDNSYENLDPLHGHTQHLRISIEQIQPAPVTPHHCGDYLQKWLTWEHKIRHRLDNTFTALDELTESKTAWLMSQTLPPGTPIFIANSMPVRDVELFWKPNNLALTPYFNRGANGIDGTLSTALGIAHQQQSAVMLTGDLALLHDTNGFLLRNHLRGSLTIVLINNNGGGIFEMLPIAQFESPFEEFFATPQHINFEQLCATYNVQHQLINSWQQLQSQLNPLPKTGIRVLELRTNRKLDARWRKENLRNFAR